MSECRTRNDRLQKYQTVEKAILEYLQEPIVLFSPGNISHEFVEGEKLRHLFMAD